MEINYSVEGFKEGQILLINKPLHWTSFDVVNKIRISLRNHLGIKKIKVGHAGTLDPLASGLVIVCTGKSTKKIEMLQGKEKEYIASVQVGATTPSQDLETEIDERFPWEHIAEASLEEVLKTFEGDVEQVPPVFSALKINGKKAYDLARKGEDIKMKSRIVNIREMELLESHLPDFKFRVTCSKGTYIRSLARDIGEKLNSGGHLTGLIRTRIGEFNIEDALEIEEFQKKIAESVTN